ncbi:activator-dependent family glycosyltransferase [Dactylosporangium sp. NBC_01737]|uniref:activator-dependent family glycosyltransferase n=1 Tax=Dactylosporangium sp. NBC_01737 TaxID=2975959 RepID=UPI002E0F9E78|nr:activator-dependent family glycosyltransferase [Dactylosporangium sp. NBC_01737]
MRVLVVTNPEKTIFQYLAPLAWALRTGGHEVRVASQPALTGAITQAGLTAVPLGRGRDQFRLAGMAPEQLEEEREGIPAPYDVAEHPDRATWEHVDGAYGQALQYWHKLENFPLIADLVAFAKAWRPDLVIWEPTAFAGAVAAKACGAAHARLLYGADVYGLGRAHYLRLIGEEPGRTDRMAEWLDGYARRHGGAFTEDMVTGHFTIDQLPRSLQTEAPDLHYVRTQYIPYGGPAVVPQWLWKQPERPRIALTMGLSATEVYNGYTVDVQDILEHLADLDVEVVATVAQNAQDKLTRIPDNARVESYVPLHALLPTCSAVIHHAGAATMATAARHPMPHLALYYHFDQPMLARSLVATGAGLAMHTGVATGAKVRDAVRRLLAEPYFRRNAVRLRDEIEESPTPNELAGQLVALTDKYRSL